MEYYSTIKANEVFITTTWMNLKGIILSEKSQSQNDYIYITKFLKLQNYEDGEQISSCLGLGIKKAKEFFW